MTHQNCSLCGIESQDDGRGFVVRGEGLHAPGALQARFPPKRNIVAIRNVGFTSIPVIHLVHLSSTHDPLHAETVVGDGRNYSRRASGLHFGTKVAHTVPTVRTEF
jgi:hypothetical protein